MEQLAYERPREKLQNRGSAYLTTVELIQIIIGSGSAQVSGARLAKQVDTRLKEQTVSLEMLRAINGIGVAKASQIMAALELGRRVAGYLHTTKTPVNPVRIKKAISKYRSLTMLAYFFDGAASEVGERCYSFKNQSASLNAKLVAKDSMILSARSVIIVLGSKRDSLETTTKELDTVKYLQDALQVLSIKIQIVYRANAATLESWADL